MQPLGIRMAVGAQPGALGLILGESIVLTVLGIMVGVPCALAATRLIAHLLYGVAPGDPLTFAAAGATLLAVGAMAGYWPARRAAKIDPMAALRCE